MLKKRSEFLRTYKGKRVLGRYYRVYHIENSHPFNRIGITTPKTMGGAVTRNRFKRWVKEIFKKHKKKGKENFKDIHIAFFIKNKKEEIKQYKWDDFKKELDQKLNEILK